MAAKILFDGGVYFAKRFLNFFFGDCKKNNVALENYHPA